MPSSPLCDCFPHSADQFALIFCLQSVYRTLDGAQPAILRVTPRRACG